MLTAAPWPARAEVLFYGGDRLGELVLENSRHDALTSAIYDDFTVTAPGWKLHALVAYTGGDELALPAAAEWEIRRGMSSGNGGALIASGSTRAFTWTPTGVKGRVIEEYVLRVDVFDQALVLPPGTYHLMLRPVMSRSELTTFLYITDGSNSIGGPSGNGDSFLHAPKFNYLYREVGQLPGQKPKVDFRYAVEGERIERPTPQGKPEVAENDLDVIFLYTLSRLLFR